MAVLKLNGTGAQARDEAARYLQQAARQLQTARDLLSREKGIGTEFFDEKLDEFIDDAYDYVRKLNKLQRN